MMHPRRIRGIVVAGLLCAAVAGCASASSGTVDAAKTTGPATTGPGTTGPGTTGSAAAASAGTAPAAAAPAGCDSVNQATMVTVRRTIRPVEPVRAVSLTVTQRKPALVRALFSDFCKIVAQPYVPKMPVNCPAAFGLDYAGTFYDGNRVLASFVYGASGCESVNVIAAGKTRHSLVMGPVVSAAPHLQADMAAVLGLPKAAVYGPPQQMNQGGPAK